MNKNEKAFLVVFVLAVLLANSTMLIYMFSIYMPGIPVLGQWSGNQDGDKYIITCSGQRGPSDREISVIADFSCREPSSGYCPIDTNQYHSCKNFLDQGWRPESWLLKVDSYSGKNPECNFGFYEYGTISVSCPYLPNIGWSTDAKIEVILVRNGITPSQCTIVPKTNLVWNGGILCTAQAPITTTTTVPGQTTTIAPGQTTTIATTTTVAPGQTTTQPSTTTTVVGQSSTTSTSVGTTSSSTSSEQTTTVQVGEGMTTTVSGDGGGGGGGGGTTTTTKPISIPEIPKEEVPIVAAIIVIAIAAIYLSTVK